MCHIMQCLVQRPLITLLPLYTHIQDAHIKIYLPWSCLLHFWAVSSICHLCATRKVLFIARRLICNRLVVSRTEVDQYRLRVDRCYKSYNHLLGHVSSVNNNVVLQALLQTGELSFMTLSGNSITTNVNATGYTCSSMCYNNLSQSWAGDPNHCCVRLHTESAVTTFAIGFIQEIIHYLKREVP